MSFVCDVPAQPTVLHDDKTARITRWDFTPGAATGTHTHGLPYFVVMLTPAKLRAKANGEISEHILDAGTSYMRAAGMEHDIQNGSEHDIAFIEIEIKTPGFLQQAKGLP